MGLLVDLLVGTCQEKGINLDLLLHGNLIVRTGRDWKSRARKPFTVVVAQHFYRQNVDK